VVHFDVPRGGTLYVPANIYGNGIAFMNTPAYVASTNALNLVSGGTTCLTVDSSGVTVPTAFRHSTSAAIGFFGHVASFKTSVSTAGNNTSSGDTPDLTYSSNERDMLNHLKTDVGTLRTTLNNLVSALQSYGLV